MGLTCGGVGGVKHMSPPSVGGPPPTPPSPGDQNGTERGLRDHRPLSRMCWGWDPRAPSDLRPKLTAPALPGLQGADGRSWDSSAGRSREPTSSDKSRTNVPSVWSGGSPNCRTRAG